MNPGTAGYGKTHCFLLPLNAAADRRSVFSPGGLCSNSSGCPQRLFQRSVLCSLAWLSHVPMSPCRGARGCQGARSLSPVGADGAAEHNPGTDKSTMLDFCYFFLDLLIFFPHSLSRHSPCFPCEG